MDEKKLYDVAMRRALNLETAMEPEPMGPDWGPAQDEQYLAQLQEMESGYPQAAVERYEEQYMQPESVEGVIRPQRADVFGNILMPDPALHESMGKFVNLRDPDEVVRMVDMMEQDQARQDMQSEKIYRARQLGQQQNMLNADMIRKAALAAMGEEPEIDLENAMAVFPSGMTVSIADPDEVMMFVDSMWNQADIQAAEALAQPQQQQQQQAPAPAPAAPTQQAQPTPPPGPPVAYRL